MNELDQKDYWYPRKRKNCENLCTKSMESCPLVISHILAEFHPEMATYTTLHNHFCLMDYKSKSAQTFTVGFVKLPSTHSIHIVVWGNYMYFPFKYRIDFDMSYTCESINTVLFVNLMINLLSFDGVWLEIIFEQVNCT